MNRWFYSYVRIGTLSGIFVAMLLSATTIKASPQQATAQPIRIEGAIVKVIDSAKVPAEVSGVLLQLEFREGHRVEKGDLLAKIKSNDLTLEVRRAKSRHRIASAKGENQIDIQFAKKSAEVSSAKLNRSLSSNQKAPGVVSRGRLQELELEAHRDKLRIEQATKDVEVAKMEMELTQADIELSESKVKQANILSPIDGVVVLIEKNLGEWVEPGETVAKVVRLDRLRLEGFIPARQAGRITIGDTAKVFFDQDWISNPEIEGKVAFVNPEANPVNSQVEVWIEIGNPDGKILPGLEATVEIDCSSTDS